MHLVTKCPTASLAHSLDGLVDQPEVMTHPHSKSVPVPVARRATAARRAAVDSEMIRALRAWRVLLYSPTDGADTRLRRSRLVAASTWESSSLSAQPLASLQGGLVLTQARRDPAALRRALDGALALIATHRPVARPKALREPFGQKAAAYKRIP